MESNKITKSELIDMIAEKSGMTKSDVNLVLQTEKEIIQQVVASGKAVTIPSHVTFEPKDRAARKGHNPQTGEPIDIPAKRGVKVRVSNSFNELVNNSK